MNQKRLFNSIFLLLTISLVVLPFLVTFNEVLTKFVEKFHLYRLIQAYIVPIQVQLVGVVVGLFNISYTPYGNGFIVGDTYLKVTWNCIGWQSLLLFIGSLFVALKGTSFTTLSKLKAIVIGLLGIFWVNIFRMSFIVLLANISMPVFRIVFHDYLAAIVTIIYLFAFWSFAHGYILEGKGNILE